MHATVELVNGSPHQLTSLYSWLQRDDDLRGQVKSVAADSKPGDMGSVTELLTVALGSGGAVAALSSTLNAWVAARRSKILIEITNGDSTQRVEINSANADTAALLLREAYNAIGERP